MYVLHLTIITPQTEVSDLSQAIDDFEFVDQEVEKKQPSGTKESSIAQTLKNTTMSDIVKKQLTRKDTVMSEIDSESEDEETNDAQIASAKQIAQTLKNKAGKGSAMSNNDSESEDEDNNDKMVDQSLDYSQDGVPRLSPQKSKSWSALRRDTSVQSDTSDVSETQTSHPPEVFSDGPPPVQNVNEPVQNLLRGTSTTSQIKSLLYRWEEPVNKQDKEIEDPTIHEILQFRRALSFLEDTHPFGLSFGPANNRDTCIKSAKTLYRRLLALTPGSTVLHFDVIGVLAYNADGSFDERKAKELVKLFRPDKHDEINLLAFVQSCDTAYKKLRYLRAGVGNSTSIDDVLENFFNGAFTFCLGLGVMAIMRMNPWTLLVSMSTILVSFAFAFGQSVAQIIEGCIMIAVRRPFDLGDRISIADASDKPENSDPGYGATWLVEDCNLFTTTLRLSKSNEIATVKNGSIASNKIINHNRSLRALVNIVLSMKCSVTQEEAMIVKSAIEQYIRDNPRTWSTLINFRIIEMDPCNDVIRYAVRVQHQRSWQDQQPILTARGELLKFATEVLIQLGIQYETKPASMHDVFVKELPESNVTQALLSQPILG
jgi:small-conductance mechanosensitive channel